MCKAQELPYFFHSHPGTGGDSEHLHIYGNIFSTEAVAQECKLADMELLLLSFDIKQNFPNMNNMELKAEGIN